MKYLIALMFMSMLILATVYETSAQTTESGDDADDLTSTVDYENGAQTTESSSNGDDADDFTSPVDYENGAQTTDASPNGDDDDDFTSLAATTEDFDAYQVQGSP